MNKIYLKFIQKSLKILGKLTVKKYKPCIIGVTGNVGKTSTKKAIYKVLSQIRRTRCSSKSFNNEFGLPLTILGDWSETGSYFFWLKVLFFGLKQLIFTNKFYPEVLILEYGISKPGDMSYLLEIAQPHIGVFTAVGEIPVHIEFFKGPEEVFKEKVKLITSLTATGFAFLNADDGMVLKAKELTKAKVVTYGFSEKADIKISHFQNKVEKGKLGVIFKVIYDGNVVPVKVNNILGKAPVYSLTVACGVGLLFGLNLVRICEILTNENDYFEKGRMRVLEGINNCLIIDDTYNAAPLAMISALETLRSLKIKRKIAVLGDMLELGKYTLEAHQKVGQLAAKSVHLLFTVGEKAKIISETASKFGLKNKTLHFDKLNDLILALKKEVKEGDVILFKASQGVRLEKVVKEFLKDKDRAKDYLVRQEKGWLIKKGLYE